jgi:hypothetical protein
LERTRALLADRLGRTVDDLTVVLHSSDRWLIAASPFLPFARLLAAPAARRYLVGWAGRRELHVLTPRALEARAAGSGDSREMLLLSPSALYARRVLADAVDGLPPPNTPGRLIRYLRWAWLAEGGAQFFSGQTAHVRPALVRRLREGPTPTLPPAARDAPLLGGMVFDMLARREGMAACVKLATHLDPRGSTAALRSAFGGLRKAELDQLWERHLEAATAA